MNEPNQTTIPASHPALVPSADAIADLERKAAIAKAEKVEAEKKAAAEKKAEKATTGKKASGKPAEQKAAPTSTAGKPNILALMGKIVDKLTKSGPQTVAAMAKEFRVTEQQVRQGIDRARLKKHKIERLAPKTFGFSTRRVAPAKPAKATPASASAAAKA